MLLYLKLHGSGSRPYILSCIAGKYQAESLNGKENAQNTADENTGAAPKYSKADGEKPRGKKARQSKQTAQVPKCLLMCLFYIASFPCSA